MSIPVRLTASALFLCVLAAPSTSQTAALPSFRMQEIETKLGVGYAVLLVDVDHDGKNDIVVVDTVRVVWYANPDWTQRVIRQVGNYGELFDRNLGQKSSLKLERRLNNLSRKGGLLHAPPFR